MESNQDPNTVFDDYYFFHFQDLLAIKAQTLELVNRIHQKFFLPDYTSYAWHKLATRKINKTQLDILRCLTSNNTKIHYNGHDGLVKDLMTTCELTGPYETREYDYNYAFKVYLQCQLGYLTTDQIRKLEDFHRKINDDLLELYGTMEYHKVSGAL
jgi:hypothetical protein